MKQTIYKLDSKGNLRFLTVLALGDTLMQTSGIVGGNPVTHTKVCKPKNVGKINESTAEEQAKVEVSAMINIKLSEDYSLTEEEARANNKVFPMLAKEYPKECHKIDYEGDVYVQPKLDGMRCLTVIKNKTIKLTSRDGKEITTVPHIAKALEPLLEQYDDIILDGELYSHGRTFQENMRLIKKNRPETKEILYHIYDVVANTKFKRRIAFVGNIFEALSSGENNHYISSVTTLKVSSEEQIKRFHESCIISGYEGSMVRHGDVPYKINGRSSNLLKLKDFKDLALKIKDVRPADQRPDWGVPVFDWPGAKDNELKAGTKLSHEERIDLLKNKDKYIGQTAELRFFEYSEEGVPRFPVMVGIRLDK